MSSQELIPRLINDLSNEKSTEFILPYKPENVEALKEVVDAETEKFEQMRDNARENAADNDGSKILRRIQQAQELDLLRIKFLIRSYYQTRFNKIVKYVERGIIPEEANLSSIENQFVTNLVNAMKNNQGPATLEFTPESEASVDHGFVFFKALRTSGSQSLTAFQDSEPVDIVKDQIYFAKYDAIEHLYNSGDVVFI